jgi:hypothetical protein
MKLLAAVAGVLLLALTIAGKPGKGPKPKTAMYTIQGHVCSGLGSGNVGQWNCVVVDDTDAVEIGVNAGGWIPEDGTLALQVSGDVLCANTRGEDGVWPETCDALGLLEPHLSGGPYYGRVRLLDHRFDFEFDTNPDGCKFIGWDTPFPLQEGDGYCRYGLIFVGERWNPDGSVAFSEFRFLDYTKGDSLTDFNNYRGGGHVLPGWCCDGDGNQLRIQLLYPAAADDPGGGEPCDLALKGEPCTVGSDCCSGKCTGKQRAKTCK